jgi:hypothetical protein
MQDHCLLTQADSRVLLLNDNKVVNSIDELDMQKPYRNPLNCRWQRSRANIAILF